MGVTKKKYEPDKMFEMFKSYYNKGCIMGAGSKGKDETLTEGRGKDGGIVPGHACKLESNRFDRGIDQIPNSKFRFNHQCVRVVRI